jgi:hypothetical protein
MLALIAAVSVFCLRGNCKPGLHVEPVAGAAARSQSRTVASDRKRNRQVRWSGDNGTCILLLLRSSGSTSTTYAADDWLVVWYNVLVVVVLLVVVQAFLVMASLACTSTY